MNPFPIQFSIRNLIWMVVVLSLMFAIAFSWFEYQTRESNMARFFVSRADYVELDKALSQYHSDQRRPRLTPSDLDEEEAVVHVLGQAPIQFEFHEDRLIDQDEDGYPEYQSYDRKYFFALVKGKLMLRDRRSGEIVDPEEAYRIE